eukprot:CAMPEP_0118708838 /NCGR_PEP_ID=MMETSP0800-20121206/22196_1 /TAXON_ID=210618 ORGANISM="Striatella unipunctata, Strain CCMP2910" /NCGR_SAMPLE_ID=MMETSP0800 /ASSEMBLY_ACC=CAM_ASM_000638 /LENGTH=340 /DNA_ID=CAMNT_0006612249 /DNA_START=17 /DNA_END=1039 /DNA_ORIENTATION=+
MKCIVLSISTLLLGISSTIAAPFHNNVGASVFGIPRGGGLFGSDEKATAPAAGQLEKFPAMSRDEVEEWLRHIPVFTITDPAGKGIVLSPENETPVSYFFLSPQMANSTLQQIMTKHDDVDLRIATVPLGKVYFRIWGSNSTSQTVTTNLDGEESTAETEVEYRLVPDTRDVLGARMLLTMDPEEGEKLRESGTLSNEAAQKAVEKAIKESPKFNKAYNEIPIFMIAQLRMQRPSAEEGEEPTQLMPIYFSLQNMVNTWQKISAQKGPEFAGAEPAINLLDLKEFVDKMQQESEVDFRNIILIPSVPTDAGPSDSDVGEQATVTGSTLMEGPASDTLGDL